MDSFDDADTTNTVRSARRPDVQKVEGKVLGFAGGGLLVFAGFFLWKELHLQADVLMLAGTAMAVAVTAALRQRRFLVLGPVLLLGSTALGASWYAGTRTPLLLLSLALSFGAALTFAVKDLTLPLPESLTTRWHKLASWHGAALAGLATSLATYFHLFDASDLGLQDFTVRRAILSLLWVSWGVAMVLIGRKRKATEVRDAGFLVLFAAVTKLVTYDTTHLDGVARIAALAVAGAMLMGSAAWVGRLGKRSA